MRSSWYSQNELSQMGFKSIGENNLLSKNTQIYSPEKIVIGNNNRIDDFCILSGNIEIGNYIHIAAGCYLYGSHSIVMKDFSAISSRSAIYSATDDYSGEWFTNPTIQESYRHIIHGPVILNKHVIIGSGCTILPNVIIGEGVAVGAMSLVNKNLQEWGTYVGIPCVWKKERSQKVLELEEFAREY